MGERCQPGKRGGPRCLPCWGGPGCCRGPADGPVLCGPTRRMVAVTVPLGSAAGLLRGQAVSC